MSKSPFSEFQSSAGAVMIRVPAGSFTMGSPESEDNTLAAIGIHDTKLRKRAIAIGEKIGLYRDWPVSKGCTPPLCAGVGGLHGEAAGLKRAARHLIGSFGTCEDVAEAIISCVA